VPNTGNWSQDPDGDLKADIKNDQAVVLKLNYNIELTE